jgi:hypothetical protein
MDETLQTLHPESQSQVQEVQVSQGQAREVCVPTSRHKLSRDGRKPDASSDHQTGVCVFELQNQTTSQVASLNASIRCCPPNELIGRVV